MRAESARPEPLIQARVEHAPEPQVEKETRRTQQQRHDAGEGDGHANPDRHPGDERAQARHARTVREQDERSMRTSAPCYAVAHGCVSAGFA